MLYKSRQLAAPGTNQRLIARRDLQRSWLRLLLKRAAIRPRKTGIALAAAVRNWQLLAAVLFARDLAPVRRELRRQPGIAHFLAKPFLTSSWDSRTRLAVIVDHWLIVERLGAPFDCDPGEREVLTALPQPLGDYTITIEAAGPTMRDGFLTLALVRGDRRMFALSFIFATRGAGLDAYIGAVQGSAERNAGQSYRAFTKAAEGIRPRDFMIELFRVICRRIGVSRIYGVSDRIRHQKSAYYRIGADDDFDQVKLDYDAMWAERGGRLLPSGFFRLAVDQPHRPAETIPARKRAQYRRRDELWLAIERAIDEAGVI